MNRYRKFEEGRLGIARGTAGMSGEQALGETHFRNQSSLWSNFWFSTRLFGENSSEPNRSLGPKTKSIDRIEWMQLVPRWTMLVNTSCVYY